GEVRGKGAAELQQGRIVEAQAPRHGPDDASDAAERADNDESRTEASNPLEHRRRTSGPDGPDQQQCACARSGKRGDAEVVTAPTTVVHGIHSVTPRRLPPPRSAL